MPVAPSMERSLGYPGYRRYVSFTRNECEEVYWTDGIDHGCTNVGIWESFVKHPLIGPHLDGYRLKGRIVEPEELTVFESAAEALKVELEELGDAILLDRKERVAYVGFFARVFLNLVILTAHEWSLNEWRRPDDEEGEQDTDESPQTVDQSLQSQLLEWLDASIAKAS